MALTPCVNDPMVPQRAYKGKEQRRRLVLVRSIASHIARWMLGFTTAALVSDQLWKNWDLAAGAVSVLWIAAVLSGGYLLVERFGRGLRARLVKPCSQEPISSVGREQRVASVRKVDVRFSDEAQDEFDRLVESQQPSRSQLLRDHLRLIEAARTVAAVKPESAEIITNGVRPSFNVVPAEASPSSIEVAISDGSRVRLTQA